MPSCIPSSLERSLPNRRPTVWKTGAMSSTPPPSPMKTADAAMRIGYCCGPWAVGCPQSPSPNVSRAAKQRIVGSTRRALHTLFGRLPGRATESGSAAGPKPASKNNHPVSKRPENKKDSVHRHLASRITLPHFSVSAAMNRSHFSGVDPSANVPSPAPAAATPRHCG